MTCRHIKLPDGVEGIACGPRERRQRCRNGWHPNHPHTQCGRWATKLCDFALPGGKTCDMPLCDICAVHVGRDRDLCPEHAQAGQKEMAV